MRIEPGTHDGQIRLKALDDLVEIATEELCVFPGRKTMRQGTIKSGTLTLTLASLMLHAGTGIVRMSVERIEEYTRVVVKNILSAVPVMNVEVDNQHLLLAPTLSVPRGDRDVVDHAKTHCTIRASMMARGPDECERRRSSSENLVNCLDRSTGRKVCGINRVRREDRVGIKAPRASPGRLETLDMRFSMTTQDRLRRHRLRSQKLRSFRNLRVRHESILDGLQSLGTLGMPAGVMFEVDRVRDNGALLGHAFRMHSGRLVGKTPNLV